MTKKYVEIRFKLPIEDFAIYEIEANENGLNSGTAQIKAETRKQAKIKRRLLQMSNTDEVTKPNAYDRMMMGI